MLCIANFILLESLLDFWEQDRQDMQDKEIGMWLILFLYPAYPAYHVPKKLSRLCSNKLVIVKWLF